MGQSGSAIDGSARGRWWERDRLFHALVTSSAWPNTSTGVGALNFLQQVIVLAVLFVLISSESLRYRIGAGVETLWGDQHLPG